MTSELHRLIARHAFLRGELCRVESELRPAESAAIRQQCEQSRDAILAYQGERPNDNIEQLRVLVASIVDDDVKSEKAGVLGALCDHRLDKLKGQIAEAGRRLAGVAPINFHHLDSLVDRVSVIDATYRYVFTNEANVRFHRSSARSFIGRPLWSTVGSDVFEGHMRPKLDAVLAGQSITHFSKRAAGDTTQVFAVTIDPIAGADGKVERVILISRDISGIDVHVDGVVPLRSLHEAAMTADRLDGRR